MAKSQETFSKKEKEKKRQKKRKEKMERRLQRKLEKAERGPRSFEDMISYVDENGNIVDTPPDPSKKKIIKLEDIQLGATPIDHTPMDTIRKGEVKFFNEEKGYGFIIDLETKESVFVHVNNVLEPITQSNMVTFEVEMGPKGANAVRVSIVRQETKSASEKPTSEKADTKIDSGEEKKSI